MATLEKATLLLRVLPEQELETVYTFIRFIMTNNLSGIKKTSSAFGIAHKYANPDLIEKEKEVFANAMIRKHILF